MKEVESCNSCGHCKSNCVSFKTSLDEKYSPRGRALMIKKDYYDESFYYCTLCNACKSDCPTEVDLKLRRQRVRLVNKGIETKANKKMIKNIRKTGNIYGF